MRVYRASYTSAHLRRWLGLRLTLRSLRGSDFTTSRQRAATYPGSDPCLIHSRPCQSSVRSHPSCAPCPRRLRRAPIGLTSSGAICCVSFSVACRRDQPKQISGCARGSASASFTSSDGPAVPSPVGGHFVSDLPSPSGRCRQAAGRRGVWFRSITSFFTYSPTTSSRRAKTAPASERLDCSGRARALHRHSSYCADPTHY